MEVNGIRKDQYEVMIGNIIDDKAVQDAVGYEKYDIVAANILADVLVPLTPVIIHQMKPGAVYITSGIIEDKENVVVEAVKAAGLEVLEAVSYTHLDVYKRQHIGRTWRSCLWNVCYGQDGYDNFE